MKKISYYICITFVAIGITSCVKKTEGNIANTWRVISYYEETTDGNSVNGYSTADSPDSPNELTIEKDGTWIWKRGYTVSGVVFGGSVYLTNKESTTQSGTWSFVKVMEGDHTEKNDHLLFNILSESTTHSQTGGGNNPIFPDTTTTTSQTYLTGENKLIYTITKSDRKLVWLESESSTTNSSGEISTKKIKLTLEIKE